MLIRVYILRIRIYIHIRIYDRGSRAIAIEIDRASFAISTRTRSPCPARHASMHITNY